MFRRALHIASILLWVSALLYGPVKVHASEAPSSAAGEPAKNATQSDHLALLLPTGSDAFAKAAEAVRAGFLEAAKKETSTQLDVRLYSVSDDPQSVIAAYRQAIESGARMVIGPLTRNGVTALAAESTLITVPTLALNVPEGTPLYPPNFFSLSLHIESEAREAAQLALRDGRRNAITITDASALGRRMRDAFIEEFQNGGGTHVMDFAYATDSTTLERLRQSAGSADMVFLAVDAARARVVRPQVAALPAYGTSQLNPSLSALPGLIDLSDVRFLDMPWMLQREHPAVMVYSREPGRDNDDLERLRALGIDAYRVAHELLAGNRDFDIDGVTGHLTLGPEGQVKRALLVALINGGKLSIVGEFKP